MFRFGRLNSCGQIKTTLEQGKMYFRFLAYRTSTAYISYICTIENTIIAIDKFIILLLLIVINRYNNNILNIDND